MGRNLQIVSMLLLSADVPSHEERISERVIAKLDSVPLRGDEVEEHTKVIVGGLVIRRGD
jgi:hypothetical protein